MVKLVKPNKCPICNKSVYNNDDPITINDKMYHGTCARCDVCNKKLSIKSFATYGTRLLCKPHFKSEFATSGGKYAGDENFKQKSRSSTVGAGTGSGVVTASVSEDDADEETTATSKTSVMTTAAAATNNSPMKNKKLEQGSGEPTASPDPKNKTLLSPTKVSPSKQRQSLVARMVASANSANEDSPSNNSKTDIITMSPLRKSKSSSAGAGSSSMMMEVKMLKEQNSQLQEKLLDSEARYLQLQRKYTILEEQLKNTTTVVPTKEEQPPAPERAPEQAPAPPPAPPKNSSSSMEVKMVREQNVQLQDKLLELEAKYMQLSRKHNNLQEQVKLKEEKEKQAVQDDGEQQDQAAPPPPPPPSEATTSSSSPRKKSTNVMEVKMLKEQNTQLQDKLLDTEAQLLQLNRKYTNLQEKLQNMETEGNTPVTSKKDSTADTTAPAAIVEKRPAADHDVETNEKDTNDSNVKALEERVTETQHLLTESNEKFSKLENDFLSLQEQLSESLAKNTELREQLLKQQEESYQQQSDLKVKLKDETKKREQLSKSQKILQDKLLSLEGNSAENPTKEPATLSKEQVDELKSKLNDAERKIRRIGRSDIRYTTQITKLQHELDSRPLKEDLYKDQIQQYQLQIDILTKKLNAQEESEQS